MSKTVFLFSGQGSQKPGMGVSLWESYPEARRVYEAASEALGYDVQKLSAQGSPAQLAETRYSQPLIFTLSLAAYAVMAARGLKPDAVAGFSLGECSALTAAGALTLRQGFDVIRKRASAMQRAAERTPGAMFAVIGLPAGEIEKACARTAGRVWAVNYNSPSQMVIAGEETAAAAAAETLHAAGARTVRLAVGAAFHCELMEPASETFYEGIRQTEFARPRVPVYSNVTGGPLPVGEPLALYLRRQMVSPVRFTDELNAMKKDGFQQFVELGPGRTLCGLVRKTLTGVECLNVGSAVTAEACLSALGT